MKTSFNTLALGTGAGTLAVTAVAAAIMGALTLYTLLHHKQVFAWAQKMRKKDEETADLDKPARWVDDLYEAQCGLAQKPCHAGEFEKVAWLGNMIKGVASYTESVRPELDKVAKRVQDYIKTSIPEPGPNVKMSLVEHRVGQVQAMKQEAARAELEQAIITAQQKIKSLRRS